ncbi:hypothetical protein HYH02_014116 [Chlamydomonas schloesseri]|uniref:Uncharacterized protein n=1 Tax=Chlamydomonas schloesseri TaxID=2026947 RepID=A0A835SP38_9CHLO|nr:hypothetical protein HYH02_014116 [Chlamydomonas schloesseri]|eukprot:KAG2429181.1 hypothetical protein HYH02_014116 [Chlamydomonas schloesseri]
MLSIRTSGGGGGRLLTILAVRTAALVDPDHAADAFVEEYRLAGLELAGEPRQQLRSWYLQELQRLEHQRRQQQPPPPSVASERPVAPGLRELPAAPVRSSTTAKVTLLYDLEAIKPFTQQQAPADAASGAGGGSATTASSSSSARGGGGGPSRLAAAGLAPSSSPDLVAALDCLVRTVQEYGTVHAAHLFLRESTLAKAPALRKQVEQLCTWVEPAAELEAEQPQQQKDGQHPSAPRAGASRPSAASRPSRSRPHPAPHDCPLCRTACPTRLDLLQHFATSHQGPVLAATAAPGDPRARIMWTRGRPLTLSVPVPVEAGGGGGGGGGGGDAGAGAGADAGAVEQQVQVCNPQDFVFARQALLQRGHHLDDLLTAAPPATLTITPAAAEQQLQQARDSQPQPLQPGLTPQQQRQQQLLQLLQPAAVPGQGPLLDGGPGLFLHVLPAGQPGAALPGALMQVAARLAQVAEAEAEALLQGAHNGGVKGRGAAGFKGRGAGRRATLAEAAAAAAGMTPQRYLCVVTDGEELDQAVASLKRPGVGIIAVTRTTRVPSATASLRWWAVQAGEYRLRRQQQD